ncbi:MAG TPA: acetyl-CoA carboxylase biotin carboxyl carrier protein [Candidatus Methylacidiphilales bacterium]|nr:acetyl-CoA carboxylase biotin carboxyl carrier protein [Candidatus Methylacidiphilales bacterium]
MDLKEIKAVIDLMTRNGLSEFELEKGDFKLRVRRGPSGEWLSTATPAVAAPAAHTPAPLAPSAAPIAASVPSPTLTSPPQTGLFQIVSPMIGTFYRAPSPDSPPYIEVGQEVNEETVVCIIEAMKVMNEIKAETKGVIVEVLAQNGKSVDFDKPLFAVRPL